MFMKLVISVVCGLVESLSARGHRSSDDVEVGMRYVGMPLCPCSQLLLRVGATESSLFRA